MGLLDDAIRDHLDLKRRRGADPGEVEQAEREALGPVRRNPIPGENPTAEGEADGDGGLAYDQADDESWSHDSLQEPMADAGLEPVYDEPLLESEIPSAFPAPSESPAHDHDVDPLAGEDQDPLRDEPANEPFPAEPAPSRSVGDAGGVGPETAEYNVDDALAADEEREHTAEGDDVLEETPEFLQDTPDHDRLWFEQRPPKDFDFDE